MSAEIASYWLWGVWYATWWMAAVFASRAMSRPRLGVGLMHRTVAGLGACLLFLIPTDPSAGVLGRRTPALWPFAHPLWTEPLIVAWSLFGLTIVGFAFCWWARIHLGRLWSGLVTTKKDHRIVDTGPYRFVRHPIYTGVIFAALTTALIKASPAALVGFALLAVGFWMTARMEEGFLRQELGAETYDSYARRTPMLMPFGI